jgi:hypothetical protein
LAAQAGLPNNLEALVARKGPHCFLLSYIGVLASEAKSAVQDMTPLSKDLRNEKVEILRTTVRPINANNAS